MKVNYVEVLEPLLETTIKTALEAYTKGEIINTIGNKSAPVLQIDRVGHDVLLKDSLYAVKAVINIPDDLTHLIFVKRRYGIK